MPKVVLTKTGDRKQNILESLKPLEEEIKTGIGDKQVILKPNCVSDTIQLASTHVDHLRGILDFLKPLYKKKIIIAESSAFDSKNAFKNFEYEKLTKEYNAELKDLNDDVFEEKEIINSDYKPLKIRIAKTLLDQNNYIISAAKLKTHDTVVATLSLKNIVMASMLKNSNGNDKVKMHAGIKQINKSLFMLAKEGLKPDLASIDGFIGMEGEGPVDGGPVEMGIAIASTDFLAADRVALELMEIAPEKIGYLMYCRDAELGEYDLNKIKIIGEKPKNLKKQFKLHSSAKAQFNWR
tara:strand:- start:2784 stop:3668 length:885 start_codon:yes stop_codon:yes gene_type:complete